MVPSNGRQRHNVCVWIDLPNDTLQARDDTKVDGTAVSQTHQVASTVLTISVLPSVGLAEQNALEIVSILLHIMNRDVVAYWAPG